MTNVYNVALTHTTTATTDHYYKATAADYVRVHTFTQGSRTDFSSFFSQNNIVVHHVRNIVVYIHLG